MALFVVAMAMNIQYSLTGYGITKHSLHSAILAIGTDEGTSGNIPAPICYKKMEKTENHGYDLFCGKNTSEEIAPCPNRDWGYYDTSCTDRCHNVE